MLEAAVLLILSVRQGIVYVSFFPLALLAVRALAFAVILLFTRMKLRHLYLFCFFAVFLEHFELLLAIILDSLIVDKITLVLLLA